MALSFASCAFVNALEEPPAEARFADAGDGFDAGYASDAGPTDAGAPDAGTTRPNEKPVVASVTITPASPTKATALTAISPEPSDADSDTVTLKYAWAVNGTVVDGQTGPSLATNFFNKGQVVTVTVTPNDTKDDGDPVSANATIGNSVPTAPVATITANPQDADDIICSIAIASADLDAADTVAYLFSWTKNGQPLNGATYQPTSSLVPNALTADDDAFVCTVAATDGSFTTAGSSTTTRVKPPMIPCSASISTPGPSAGTLLVPTDVAEVEVWVWGAGGGGVNSNEAPFGTAAGGAGAFVSGTIPVGPGDRISATVGAGGLGFNYRTGQPPQATTRSLGGGGAGGPDTGAAGGGRSSVLKNGTEVAIAGGGGGATHDSGGYGRAGGNAGLASGEPGTDDKPGYAGHGGSDTGPGAGGLGGSGCGGGSPGQSGNGHEGGNAGQAGGGGGGGRWGGGGGGAMYCWAHGSGGGGSSLIPIGGGGLTGMLSTAPAMDRAGYLTNTAAGGTHGNEGGPGLVIIKWQQRGVCSKLTTTP